MGERREEAATLDWAGNRNWSGPSTPERELVTIDPTLDATRAKTLEEADESFRDAPRTPGPSHEQIAARAHEIYEARGRSDGHAVDDWLAAEGELRMRDDA